MFRLATHLVQCWYLVSENISAGVGCQIMIQQSIIMLSDSFVLGEGGTVYVGVLILASSRQLVIVMELEKFLVRAVAAILSVISAPAASVYPQCLILLLDGFLSGAA